MGSRSYGIDRTTSEANRRRLKPANGGQTFSVT